MFSSRFKKKKKGKPGMHEIRGEKKVTKPNHSILEDALIHLSIKGERECKERTN
jgi:hypothetical protein